MWTKRLLVCALALTILGGCATSRKINGIELGMTRDDVIKVMGEPHSISAQENLMVLNYRLLSDVLFRDDYYVRLLDGRVDTYGRAGTFGLRY